MKWGMEAWNRPDGGHAEEWDRVRALGGGCIKVRPYHPPSVLYDAHPKLVLLRRSSDGRIDPWAQVDEARAWIELCRAQSVPCVYILDNEPNHPNAPYTDPAMYTPGLAALIHAFTDNYPDVPLCSPPMCPMVDDERWIAAIEPVCRGRVAYRGAHAYWQGGNYSAPEWGKCLERYARIVPGARWIVDEVGDATPGRDAGEKAATTLFVLDWLARRGDVTAACVFLAGGTDDWRGFWLPPEELTEMRNALGTTAVPATGGTMAYTTIGNNYRVVDLRGRTTSTGEYPIRPLSNVKYLVVHHSAADTDSTAETIANWHVEHEGWPGIGYHFLVHPDGTTEYTQDISRASYNVGGRNEEVIGVCLPGDFTNHPPTEAAIAATRRLMAELQFALGWFCPVVGHRDIALEGWATACPGDTWPSWKARVQVTAPGVPDSPQPAYQFVLGFKDLAVRLGPAVGAPVENEHPGQIQETSTGYMIWSPGKAATFVQKG